MDGHVGGLGDGEDLAVVQPNRDLQARLPIGAASNHVAAGGARKCPDDGPNCGTIAVSNAAADESSGDGTKRGSNPRDALARMDRDSLDGKHGAQLHLLDLLGLAG